MKITRGTRLLMVFILMLAVLPFFGMTARAQADDIETWEGEFFPIAITYNADLWQGRSVSRFETNERFQVTARATNFLMQAFESDDLDADQCLAAYIESIEEIEALSDLEDAEDLPMPEGLGDGAEVLVTYDFLWPGREQPVSMVQYLACHEIEPGSLMLIGIETRAGIYEEELDIINALLAGIEIDA